MRAGILANAGRAAGRTAAPLLLGGLLGSLAALTPAPAVRTAQAAPPEAPAAQIVRTRIVPKPFDGLSLRFRRLARQDEKNREWHTALKRWRAVASMERGDKEANGRIKAIRALMKRHAAKHFKAAKAHQKRKSFVKAFKSYLRTLSYDPGNRHALTMVKTELNAKSVTTYKVRRGDSISKIARSQYNDMELSFLITYYNNIRNTRNLKVGQVLKIPVMAGVIPGRPAATVRVARREKPAPPPAKKAPARKAPAVAARPKPAAPVQPPAPPPVAATASAPLGGAELTHQERAPENEYDDAASRSAYLKAQRMFYQGEFKAAAAAAEGVLDEDPANGDARALVNAAYYAEGVRQQKANNPLAAMQNLKRLPPKYKDAARRLETLEEGLGEQRAEVHYIAGVTFYLEEDLDSAIREWERVLKLDPGHRQAAKDLRNAVALRAKLASVQ